MVTPKRWEEFRETGLLFYINMILHAFGWAIVVQIDEAGFIGKVYPAKVKYRGFSNEATTRAYSSIAQYMSRNGELLEIDASTMDLPLSWKFGNPLGFDVQLKKDLFALAQAWSLDADPEGDNADPEEDNTSPEERATYSTLLRCRNELVRTIGKYYDHE